MSIRHLSVTTNKYASVGTGVSVYIQAWWAHIKPVAWNMLRVPHIYTAVLSQHTQMLNGLWNDKQPSKLKDFFNVKSGFAFNKMT